MVEEEADGALGGREGADGGVMGGGREAGVVAVIDEPVSKELVFA